MLVTAHAGHWLVQVLRLVPLLALLAVFGLDRLREHRRAHGKLPRRRGR